MPTLTHLIRTLRYFFFFLFPALLVARAVVVALVVAAFVGPRVVSERVRVMGQVGVMEGEERREEVVVVGNGDGDGEGEVRKDSVAEGGCKGRAGEDGGDSLDAAHGEDVLDEDNQDQVSDGLGDGHASGDGRDGILSDAAHEEDVLVKDAQSEVSASLGDGNASGNDHDDLSPNAGHEEKALDKDNQVQPSAILGNGHTSGDGHEDLLSDPTHDENVPSKDAQSQLAASSHAQTYSDSSEPDDPPPYASREIIALIKDTQSQHSASSDEQINSDSVPSDDPPPYTPIEENTLDRDTQSQPPVDPDTRTHSDPTESDDLYTRDFKAPHYYDALIANEERELRLRDTTSLYDEARRERMTFKRTFFHPSKHQVTGFPPFFKSGSGRLAMYNDGVIDWEAWADLVEVKTS